MSDVVGFWMVKAGRYPMLPFEEVLRITKKINSLDESDPRRAKLINKVCVHNLRLVIKCVTDYTRGRRGAVFTQEQIADMLQQGYIGLRTAVIKFDPTLGYRLTTYAVPWIRQAVQRYEYADKTVRIPESALRHYFYIERNGKPRDDFSEFYRKRMGHVKRMMQIGTLEAVDAGFTGSKRDGGRSGEKIALIDLVEHDGINVTHHEENRFNDRVTQAINDSKYLTDDSKRFLNEYRSRKGFELTYAEMDSYEHSQRNKAYRMIKVLRHELKSLESNQESA